MKRLSRTSIALIFAMSSCSVLVPDRESRMRRLESAHRETLDRLYPPKTPRPDLVGRRGDPWKTVQVADDETDGFMQFADEVIRRDLGAIPVSCDVFWVWRMGLASAFSPPGIYWDYVFYDEEGLVIQARRRFVD